MKNKSAKSQALPLPLAYFYDPNDGSIFEERECEDAAGRPIVGNDDDEVWWGTTDAWWILSPNNHHVVIWGFLGSSKYCGHFMGTENEAKEYCLNHGVRDIQIGV